MEIAYLNLANPKWEQGGPQDNAEYNGIFAGAWGTSKPPILSGGFSARSAQHAVDRKYAEYPVVISFGRFFISTPDPPYRVKNGLKFTKCDRETLYTPCSKKGYTDYPFSEEFLAEAIV
jgi:2,4-dienoyl-CoA reductase-like NADH-dependent reductase (Old Yellow Enzyme family)